MPDRESTTGRPHILAAIASGAGAFLLTAALLHTLLPDPMTLHADVRSEKLEMLREWHGQVFSAAFGSSHVHFGFDPRAFDHTLAGTPLATSSANLAIEGGSQSEQRVMALQFLNQLESPSASQIRREPCLILLEIGAGANFTRYHLVHPRAINIYDWPTTVFITHFLLPGASTEQRLGRIGYALTSASLHYLNTGMLSNTIFSPPLNQAILDDQTIDGRRGELVTAGSAQVTESIRRDNARHPPTLPLTNFPLTAGASDLVAQLATSPHAARASFVYFEMPKAGDVFGAYRLPDELDVPTSRGLLTVPIINLARPDHFPQFYEPALWHDNAHLNGQGAQVVTGVLAEQLKLWYATHPMPQPCED